MTMTFKVEGFAELYNALDHLPDLAKRKGLEPLVIKALEPMRDTAIYLAPDDPSTGPPYDLKSSIKIGTKKRGVKAYDRIDAAIAYMGPTREGYPQATMQEFGTINHVATPYMRPAYHADRDKALEIIKKGFAAQVEATVAKYGRRR